MPSYQKIPYQLDPTKLLMWDHGRPAEIWRSHYQVVRDFIKQYEMKPMAMDDYPYYQTQSHMAEVEIGPGRGDLERAELWKRWPQPFPGGIRIPHFHFGRDVYLVERDQWNEFSSRVVKDLQERLAQANDIGFEQTLALNDAVTTIR